MPDLTEVEKQEMKMTIDWALGQNRFNGARADLKRLVEVVGESGHGGQSGTGLAGKVEEQSKILERFDERDKRTRYIFIGLMLGMFIVLIFLAWQGNQQAQTYLELFKEIKDVVP